MYARKPRAVVVAATEDSWEHTIVPRLIAAGADLALVFRVDVISSDQVDTGVSLPRDLAGLEQRVTEADAALILLDPLLSRLDASLDTHKDAEVRIALEPLVSLADRTGACVLGIIHVNKSTSNDPLTTIMASRAFAAVARAVLFVAVDPDDPAIRLIGQVKNNLGRSDLPTLTFRIVATKVADTDEGPVLTGKLEWIGESDRSIRDAIESAAESRAEDRTATQEAADWLSDYMTSEGGTVESSKAKKAGQSAGHSESAIKRARKRLRIDSTSREFPRRTFWILTNRPVGSPAGESELTELTGLTEPTRRGSGQSGQWGQSGVTPRKGEPTARRPQ